MRLDAYLAQKFPEKSRSTWAKLIRRGDVKVNGEVAAAVSKDVTDSDSINVKTLPQQNDMIDLPVIYEDENVVVIDKPAGVLTHSKGALNDEFTVADFVAARPSAHYEATSNRSGIVHRLDRATSGVIIGAKNDAARKFLQKQFSDRKAHKTYLAIVAKAPKEFAARIDLPIARNPKKPAEFRVDTKGKPAVTDYKTLEIFADGSALLELKPLTGRTHQLRVHLAHIDAPIVGDVIYNTTHKSFLSPPGSDPGGGGRMMLNAAELEITIPGGKRKVFRAQTPKEFNAKSDPK